VITHSDNMKTKTKPFTDYI